MAFNSLNNWTGVGRITADPELKTTSSGVSVIGFTAELDRVFNITDGVLRSLIVAR